MPIRAVICDFGGVLTSPLIGAFANFQEDTGVTLEQLGTAMAAGADQLDGANPLFELECGRISEERFLDDPQGRARADHGRASAAASLQGDGTSTACTRTRR